MSFLMRISLEDDPDHTEGKRSGPEGAFQSFIPKILRAIRKNGSPPPIFETDADRTYFVARFHLTNVITNTIWNLQSHYLAKTIYR